MDLLKAKRKRNRETLDIHARNPNYAHTLAEGQNKIIDIILADLTKVESKKKEVKCRRYSDEEVKERKGKLPRHIEKMLIEGVNPKPSVHDAVLYLVVTKVQMGHVSIPTHTIEKDWPGAIERMRGKACTPGTVSRRFRELQDEGLIEAEDCNARSTEGHWKITRLFGWPVTALGTQQDLF